MAQKLSGIVNGEQATVAAARAQLAIAKSQVDSSRADVANAQWSLDQTDCLRADQRLRHQCPVAARFVRRRDAARAGDHLRRGGVPDHRAVSRRTSWCYVEPGNHAEIQLPTHPGRVIKATVDSIVWAQGQGQVAPSTALPQTGGYPQAPGRFPVKLKIDDSDRDLFLAAGAAGSGAIYTEHVAAIHILRMVILRINSITNYLVLKLH